MYGNQLCLVFFFLLCFFFLLLFLVSVFFFLLSSSTLVDRPLARKVVARKQSGWAFMTYCLVYHLQGSISLRRVIAVSGAKEHKPRTTTGSASEASSPTLTVHISEEKYVLAAMSRATEIWWINGTALKCYVTIVDLDLEPSLTNGEELPGEQRRRGSGKHHHQIQLITPKR